MTTYYNPQEFESERGQTERSAVAPLWIRRSNVFPNDAYIIHRRTLWRCLAYFSNILLLYFWVDYLFGLYHFKNIVYPINVVMLIYLCFVVAFDLRVLSLVFKCQTL